MTFDGESPGFGLSVERALGKRWGVALEFVGPGTMERTGTQELPVTIAIFPPVPPVQFGWRVEQRRLSWNTLAWVSQPLGDRVELAILGGISFTRTRLTQAASVTLPATTLPRPDIVPFVALPSTTITFGVDPVVGMDARIRLSEHVAAVPGVRFQSAGAGGRMGWLLRPSAAIRWGF